MTKHHVLIVVRQTAFTLLVLGPVQEAHDLALTGSAATLKSCIPFIRQCHGFRSSHEAQKIELTGNGMLGCHNCWSTEMAYCRRAQRHPHLAAAAGNVAHRKTRYPE